MKQYNFKNINILKNKNIYNSMALLEYDALSVFTFIIYLNILLENMSQMNDSLLNNIALLLSRHNASAYVVRYFSQ